MINYNKKILPSILSFDLTNINSEISKLKKLYIDIIHYDFVDINYAPTPTPFLDEYVDILIQNNFNLNVHIMTKTPHEIAQRFLQHKINSLIFQYEVLGKSECIKLINNIKSNNVQAGIAIRPHDNNFFDLLQYCDFVLLMTVVPGKGGQKFIDDSIETIYKTYEYIKANNLSCKIIVDGGINLETIDNIIEYADWFVSGSGFMNVSGDKQLLFLKKVKEYKNG